VAKVGGRRQAATPIEDIWEVPDTGSVVSPEGDAGLETSISSSLSLAASESSSGGGGGNDDEGAGGGEGDGGGGGEGDGGGGGLGVGGGLGRNGTGKLDGGGTGDERGAIGRGESASTAAVNSLSKSSRLTNSSGGEVSIASASSFIRDWSSSQIGREGSGGGDGTRRSLMDAPRAR